MDLVHRSSLPGTTLSPASKIWENFYHDLGLGFFQTRTLTSPGLNPWASHLSHTSVLSHSEVKKAAMPPRPYDLVQVTVATPKRTDHAYVE